MRALLAALAGLALLSFGPLGCREEQPKDPFLDLPGVWSGKQSEQAEKAPEAPKTAKPEPGKSDPAKAVDATPLALPTRPVSLKMYNADLNAVLRVLAQVAGQNVVLSPGIGAKKVNISVESSPWNEVFMSILRANGLTCEREGKILVVRRLELPPPAPAKSEPVKTGPVKPEAAKSKNKKKAADPKPTPNKDKP